MYYIYNENFYQQNDLKIKCMYLGQMEIYNEFIVAFFIQLFLSLSLLLDFHILLLSMIDLLYCAVHCVDNSVGMRVCVYVRMCASTGCGLLIQHPFWNCAFLSLSLFLRFTLLSICRFLWLL